MGFTQAPPSAARVSTRDWACAEKTYSLWEVLFKAHESKTYPCSWRGDALRFTVDFASGFTCCDSRTQTILWSFRFSQLRGSSDDGKARLKLLFQHLHTRQVETKELEFQDLTAVLHCVHAFLAAKVASWTPALRAARASAGSPRAAAERSVKDEN
uniref:Syntrophin gamma 2 n=1 Tax=Myotis myotis TaxID=51298 RepID=A0A7J7U6I2_MYOMY|nr:syntrophin gamma 2 [Myotis myotis]